MSLKQNFSRGPSWTVTVPPFSLTEFYLQLPEKIGQEGWGDSGQRMQNFSYVWLLPKLHRNMELKDKFGQAFCIVVKSPSHTKLLLFHSHLQLLIPASAPEFSFLLIQAAVIAQVHMLLQPTWEIWTQFLDPGFILGPALIIVCIWDQWKGVRLCVCLLILNFIYYTYIHIYVYMLNIYVHTLTYI